MTCGFPTEWSSSATTPWCSPSRTRTGSPPGSSTDRGELVDRRVWAQLEDSSAPDGLCADAEGAIWYASVPGQRCSRVAEGGEVLQTVLADRGCFACMLGGDDGRTLYVVANCYTGGAASDGVVLTHRVAVARAGRP